MSHEFVHLHSHTEYSLLDGAARVDAQVEKAKEMGQTALAITDHGVMFGAMRHFWACKAAGIKPIIGMEAYVAPEGHEVRAGKPNDFHLLLLARNEKGYRNLCKLHSLAALKGFYYRPHVDHAQLAEYAEGLISTTTCLGSEVCQALMHGDYDRAKDIAAMYRDMFEKGSFFVELQDHRLPEQQRVNEGLLKIAAELSLPLVATNDSHYLCKADADSHDTLLCIGTNRRKDDENRLKFNTQEFFLKSGEEMAELFPDQPEAMENTLRIAEMCALELDAAPALMPTPELPEGMTAPDFLAKLARSGLKERNLADSAAERLEFELDVIGKTGFDSYFLLVRELAEFTRDSRIAFGVRGSAAASLVSYCLGITDVDPLEYDLTFERFLNPERLSMPDIDMDFQDDRRDEVIRFVNEQYGRDHVAQIVTFGTLGAKQVLRDAGRAMGFEPRETDALCKLIPTRPGVSLAHAVAKEQPKGDEARRTWSETHELRAAIGKEQRLRTLTDTALKLEGLKRHPGVHAAGLVISAEPLDQYIPLYRSSDGQPITAYDQQVLEKLGFLKMDLLGLSNLTVLANAIANIRASSPDDPIGKGGVEAIPQDDRKTYEMLAEGDTVGVFQLEGAGMTRAVRQLKPDSVRELAAMVALFRPGPMEHIGAFVDSKFGRRKPQYLDPRMEPILEETYGVIVYQDQVLKLVQALAGFSLGKADILRKAMGKKDRKLMAKMRDEFTAGCAANGVSSDVARRVWDLLLPFAGYAFNKAHAVCYAILAYQTAYLKANYPIEYMAALLAAYRGSEERVAKCIDECRRRHIEVLPPDVNASELDFTIQNGAIRFGLSAIKGVGEGLARAICQERSNGKYTHLYEFCKRTHRTGFNKGVLEALIKSGALAGIDPNRATLLNTQGGALAFAERAVREDEAGQTNLFESEKSDDLYYPILPAQPEPKQADVLTWEKELLGVYVTGHPLRGHEDEIRDASDTKCEGVKELVDGARVRLAGIVTSVREFTTREKGLRMCTFTLEDMSGQASCVLMPQRFELLGPVERDEIVWIFGFVQHRELRGEARIEVVVNEFGPLGAAPGQVTVSIDTATRAQLDHLRRALDSHPGQHEVVLRMHESEPLVLRARVRAGEELATALRTAVPSAVVQVAESAAGRENQAAAERVK